MLWRQHRYGQLTLEMSVRLKAKMKPEMEKKKMQLNMLQKNAYSGLLQG
jgi:hypothetical protein